jgi:uncharacterized protein (TIGR02001 family)
MNAVVRLQRLAVVAALLLAPAQLAASSAVAADSPWSAELDLATEYMSKGRSRSDGRPHAGLTLERSSGAVYVGAWAGTVTATNGADAQTNLYVGAVENFGEWELETRLAHKRRWNTAAGSDDTAVELRFQASREIGENELTLRVDATPDNYGPTEQSIWTEASVERAMSDGWTLSAELGRREQVASPDYTAWNVGATYALSEHAELDLRFYDTDGHEFDDSYDSRAVLALTISF